jgi:hypothetical protein
MVILGGGYDSDFCFDANFLQFGGGSYFDGIGQAE